MKIKTTTIYVNDQENALRFYTEVMGFMKKADFANGPFRWLTVASADEPNGVELQLALNDDPAARAYQEAMFGQNKPAVMFNVDDVQREHDRMKPLGAEFTMPPMKVTGSTIAMLNDTCGNLVQLVALEKWAG
ncbi:MAG: VOC family protein [Gemmatimonadales bacterium]